MLNKFLQYYHASAVRRLLVLDRRQPPPGSNHDLANRITRGIIISAGILAMIMSIAGLLMADTVSHISLGFAGIVTVLLVSWISRWESISTATNRRFVLIALALVQGRYLTGWLVTDAADAPGAILTGLIYTPYSFCRGIVRRSPSRHYYWTDICNIDGRYYHCWQSATRNGRNTF